MRNPELDSINIVSFIQGQEFTVIKVKMGTFKYVKIVRSSCSLCFHAYSSLCKAPKISVVCLWVTWKQHFGDRWSLAERHRQCDVQALGGYAVASSNAVFFPK